MQTPIQLPAVLLELKASEEEVVEPASLLTCWTRVTPPVETGRLVSEKFAGVAAPDTDAVTLYGPPAVPLAVKVVAVATPCAFVVAVFTPPANAPLAPLAGAIKVTVAPFTGLFPESFTVAWNGVANAVLIVALCGVPAVAAILIPVPPPVAGLNAARLAPHLS